MGEARGGVYDERPPDVCRTDVPARAPQSNILATHQTIIQSLSLARVVPKDSQSHYRINHTHNTSTMADALKAEGNKLFAEKKFAESM